MARDYNDTVLLGDRVKTLLKEKGLTQLQLAKYIGRDKDYLNACIRKGYINQSTLIEIAKYLDCHPLYINKESAPQLSFIAYTGFTYDYVDCVKGLLHMMQYNPADYELTEIVELETILGRVIDKYSIEKGKQNYDIAFWVSESKNAKDEDNFDKKPDDKAK